MTIIDQPMECAWTGCDRQVPGANGRLEWEIDMNADKTVQVRIE
jgi:hypothetical protein